MTHDENVAAHTTTVPPTNDAIIIVTIINGGGKTSLNVLTRRLTCNRRTSSRVSSARVVCGVHASVSLEFSRCHSDRGTQIFSNFKIFSYRQILISKHWFFAFAARNVIIERKLSTDFFFSVYVPKTLAVIQIKYELHTQKINVFVCRKTKKI